MNIEASFPAPAQLVPPPPEQIEAFAASASSVAHTEQLLAGIRASQARRLQHLLEVESGGEQAIADELKLCENVYYWFHWYAYTYDPRNAIEVPPLPTWLPFDLFPRQVELIQWFEYLTSIREDGCLKKSRDVGFTWLAAGLAWHKYRFKSGFKTTFGSRKGEYVDRLGDPDSYFERVRLLYKALPKWMLPVGFKANQHDNSMLIMNPENGNTIRGEGGEDMGRGGRSTWYFIDEAASIEHADRVDAATSANSEVRIWGSSINPQNENNLFQRKYTSFPASRVFRFHYSDDPRKTPEWAARKQRSVSPEKWAAEYEIDDSYTVEDIVIPASWVESSKRVAGLLQAQGIVLEPKREGIAGGDVGGGKASSVVIARFGPIVTIPKAWTDPDTIDTALKMLDYCSELKLKTRADGHEPKVKTLRFDSIAIGQGVSSTMKRNPRPGLIVVGVNVGEPPSENKWPDGETSQEKFANLKAEGWWTTREQFKRTHELVLYIESGGLVDPNRKPVEPIVIIAQGPPFKGHNHPLDDIIVLPNAPNDQHVQMLCAQLSQPKWARTEKGKVQIESKQAMSKRGLASTDYADALVLTNAGYSKAEKWAAFAKVNVG